MRHLIEPTQRDDEFLADVHNAREDAANFHLWWLGQSGFLIHWLKRCALIDPYLSDSLTHKYSGTAKPHVRMSRRVVRPEELIYVSVVSSSHNHTDHLDPDTLRPLFKTNERGPAAQFWQPPLQLIAPEANRSVAAERASVHARDIVGMKDGRQVESAGFEFTGVPAAHETIDRDEAGQDKYMGYIVRFGVWSVYHSGDTVVYEGMADRLRREGPIDIAILPINGKVGNMGGRDAARLAKDIGARLVIPCHYDMFEFNTADPKDEFIPECERLGQPYRVLKLGERFSSEELPTR